MGTTSKVTNPISQKEKVFTNLDIVPLLCLDHSCIYIFQNLLNLLNYDSGNFSTSELLELPNKSDQNLFKHLKLHAGILKHLSDLLLSFPLTDTT